MYIDRVVGAENEDWFLKEPGLILQKHENNTGL